MLDGSSPGEDHDFWGDFMNSPIMTDDLPSKAFLQKDESHFYSYGDDNDSLLFGQIELDKTTLSQPSPTLQSDNEEMASAVPQPPTRPPVEQYMNCLEWYPVEIINDGASLLELKRFAENNLAYYKQKLETSQRQGTLTDSDKNEVLIQILRYKTFLNRVDSRIWFNISCLHRHQDNETIKALNIRLNVLVGQVDALSHYLNVQNYKNKTLKHQDLNLYQAKAQEYHMNQQQYQQQELQKLQHEQVLPVIPGYILAPHQRISAYKPMMAQNHVEADCLQTTSPSTTATEESSPRQITYQRFHVYQANRQGLRPQQAHPSNTPPTHNGYDQASPTKRM